MLQSEWLTLTLPLPDAISSNLEGISTWKIHVARDGGSANISIPWKCEYDFKL